jgi:hypothetical protein
MLREKGYRDKPLVATLVHVLAFSRIINRGILLVSGIVVRSLSAVSSVTPQSPNGSDPLCTLNEPYLPPSTYAFVLASRKRINPGMVRWTLEALYVGLSHSKQPRWD